MKAHQKDAENKMAEKFIEFGKTSGFAFSKEYLLAARTELVDKANSNKELADTDLANVTGGGQQKNCVIAMSVMSGGIMCAVASIGLEIQYSSGECGKFVSTTVAC